MDIEVVVGCYEELLLGFRIVQVGENFQLEPSFTDHSHSGCIKHIAVSNKGFLASGGTDETIQLFHLGRRTQLGSLVHHSGSLTCLQFFNSSHLFSASEDGTFCIWSRATWECLKTFRGHKGPVRWLSLHPSGKLVLTVGQDKTLRTWNVITGKSAYITNIKRAADFVCWSPSGSHYAVVFTNKVDVYKLEDSVVVYGGDGGVVFFHDITKDKEIQQVDTEVNRMRGISIIRAEETEDNKFYMFTASSDGFIKMFSVILEGDEVAVDLDGEATEVLCCHYEDYDFIIATQLNKMGTMVEVTRDVVLQEMSAARPSYTTRVLLGVDETECSSRLSSRLMQADSWLDSHFRSPRCKIRFQETVIITSTLLVAPGLNKIRMDDHSIFILDLEPQTCSYS
uniref:p21-activated protein kinase-interacting protein 1-like protein n=1 Tax=Magallana gigas TaxID=29159 RepID=K1QB91_MAGGI